LSKLSQLKQEAYQAAKKRNWEQAVAVYERILELDKNNPTVINELGDICLKGGSTPAAVKHFLNAASKYRATGLLNNAVAIYKKILRYDAENLNAHWYLAETRAHQGLVVEGENHALHFLDNSKDVSGDIKEIFLKRCHQLFELYPESEGILTRLVQVYRMWKMPLEAGRVSCLLACRTYDAGDQDDARRAVEQALQQAPEVQNYPEYGQWQRRVRPQGAPAGAFGGFGDVSLDAGEPAAAPARPAEPGAGFGELELGADGAPDRAAAGRPAAETEDVEAGVADEVSAVADAAAEAADAASGGDAADDDRNDGWAWERSGAEGSADDVTVEIETDGTDDGFDDDGAIAIDEGGADFDSLIAEATSQLARRRPASEPAVEVEVDTEDCAAQDDGDAAGQGVDLLAEILADDTSLLAGGESSQLESITREIGTQVGGDESDQDPASLYEMGTVYLEMGMHLQACESFAKATDAGDPGYAMRAFEMWGVTLERAGRLDEAVEVLRRGIARADRASDGYIGLLYNLGKACEAAEDLDAAVEAYERIRERDPGYLDVGRRLTRLTAV
jgi:tetratricopeptide (TPR) repeat protein